MRISDWSSDVCSSDLELQEDRFVEPELEAADIERTLVEECAGAGELQLADVARNHAHQEEDENGRSEQGRNHHEQPLDQIRVHQAMPRGIESEKSPPAADEAAGGKRSDSLAHLSIQTWARSWFT